MITNKDIRVENGNLVLNGDKFPLDGQSPAAIMQIVEDNSDTTPTENSTAPVTSGGVYTALGLKQDTLTFDSTPTDESINPVTSGGLFNEFGSVNTKINAIAGAGKPTIPSNADMNTIEYTAVGEYTTNGSGKNIQNVPSNISNVSFWFKTINILTNKLTEITDPYEIRAQIIIPIDISAIYIRRVIAGSSASSITYDTWKKITLATA